MRVYATTREQLEVMLPLDSLTELSAAKLSGGFYIGTSTERNFFSTSTPRRGCTLQAQPEPHEHLTFNED